MTTQLQLFEPPKRILPRPGFAPRFDGPGVDSKEDRERLGAQLLRVMALMRDGQWRTLHEIAEITHDPEGSVSARLRDLRKSQFGNHQVERRRRCGGTFEYRMEE